MDYRHGSHTAANDGTERNHAAYQGAKFKQADGRIPAANAGILGTASLGNLTDIDRESLSVLDINQSTAGLLDPTFGSCSTAIPERAEVGSMLTGFAVKRGVDG